MKKYAIRMKRSVCRYLMLAFCLSLLSQNVLSQESVKIKRLDAAIVFDGVPGEQAWKSVDQFPLTMHRPNFGNQPSEQSDVRVGYDDEFLWIGASLYIEDASEIYAAT